jgi:hypothetical protein
MSARMGMAEQVGARGIVFERRRQPIGIQPELRNMFQQAGDERVARGRGVDH